MKKAKQLKGLEAWEAKYYPVGASEVSKKDALAHSLRKWKGLRKDVLEKYGIDKSGCELYDHMYCNFCANCNTCALCSLYMEDCGDCPLSSDAPNSWYDSDYACDNAYQEFRDNDDPEPMIKLLQKALKKQKGKCKRRKVK